MRQTDDSTKQPGEDGKKRRLTWWFTGLVLFAAAGGAFAFLDSGSELATSHVPVVSVAGAAPPAARRETRPTLDPARFVGKAAETHRIAREIPDVLDQLYCYCECDKGIGHKSLLSCYTDGHAAT